MPETAVETAAKTKEKIGAGLDRKVFEQRFTAMKNEAQSWLGTWKDIKSYINPVRGFFDEQPNQGKAIDHKTMLDGYPRRCARILAAGMTSGLTSPSRPWFRLSVDDPELMELDGVKLWLDDVQERMMNVYSRSNIYGVLNTVYEEVGSFGTAAAIIVEDSTTVIRGYTFTCGEYYLSIGPDGRINGFARKYYKTVGQLIAEFGIDNVSENVKTAYNNKKVDEWKAVIHLIEINDKRIPDKPDFKNMLYRSVQWEEGSPSVDFLRVGGFESFPTLTPRWQTTTTADSYGKAPGWDALGDAKMLQKMQREKLLGLAKKTNPPMQRNSQTGEVNTLPGGVTTTSASVPDAGLRPAYQVDIDLSAVQACIRETQEAIGATFYTDLFLMLLTSERKQITAREVAERHEEKLLMLGPVLECLESELLDPLIDRTFAIMLRTGLIPEPPEELQGKDLKVEYVSILAQAQKMVGTTAIEQVCGFVAQLAGVSPDVLDKIDWDEAVETYAEYVGIPAKILRSTEAVAAIREAREEAQLKAQQAQTGVTMATTAKDLSQAKVGPDNKGQNSALDAVIAALTGKKMPENPAREVAATVR